MELDDFSNQTEVPAEETALMAGWDTTGVEVPAEDTAMMAGWDTGSETLEMGFDSTAMELGDNLDLESESNSDLLTDASLVATDDLSMPS